MFRDAYSDGVFMAAHPDGVYRDAHPDGVFRAAHSQDVFMAALENQNSSGIVSTDSFMSCLHRLGRAHH